MIKDLFQNSVFLGVFLSLLAYFVGTALQKKFHKAIFNPLLIAVVLILGVLLVFHIDYDTYNNGAKYISYLLTPATVALAVPLYEQFEVLKKNWAAILIGITGGALTSMLSVFLFALVFKLDHATYVTLLPKSITTAIGMGVSEELGGYVSITVAVIVITGILGNVIAERFCKLAKITDPIAKGIAIGSSSHAMGTAKAMELGETEGAMSSLSIVVSGLLTVLGANLFAHFI